MRLMRFRWLFFLISALFLVPGIVSLVLFGLRPSIDFAGGSILEYKFEQPINDQVIRQVIEEQGYQLGSVQSTGERSYLLRLTTITKDEAANIRAGLTDELSFQPEEVRFETVGPTLGRELLRKTIFGVILAAAFIMAYVAWRFKDWKFGICAILAMFHDTLILLGIFSLLGHFVGVEVGTLFVTAVLTILSFSVHDTVVVYDRIREAQGRSSEPFESLADRAVVETLTRSLNNSLTIIFMLVALLLLGGGMIKWFVIALLVGTVAGTYSSTFTAVPLLVVWDKLTQKRRVKKK